MPVVLESEDLNEADREILDLLREGRANPSYLADLMETDRSYINQRLKRLQEHDHVDKLSRGLYELVDDPRDDVEIDEADLRVRLQDALEARDDQRARADRLEDELADCRDLLEDARAGESVDVGQLRSGLQAALSALSGQRPDAETAEAEIEAALEVLESVE